MSNNCPCILCHVGRVAYTQSSDLAPLETVKEAIRAYDVSKSPYAFTETRKEAMIAYLEKRANEELIHFEHMAYFLDEEKEGE